MNAKNPKFNSIGTIDLELYHTLYGWIPFTASPNDIEEHGRNLYSLAISGNFGEIGPYIKPKDIEGEDAILLVRQKRKSIFENFIDPIVSNPLRWNEITENERQILISYRNNLLNLTDLYPNPIWVWDDDLLDYKEKNFSFPVYSGTIRNL